MNPDLEKMVRSCIGKKKYSSAQFARYVADKAERRGRPLRVYHCPTCDRWHLTSQVRGAMAVLCGTCMEPFEPQVAQQWQCAGCQGDG